MLSEVSVPDFSWYRIEEGIKRLKEVRMLAWLYYKRLENPSNNYTSQVVPAATTSTKVIRNAQVRGTQHH